MPQENVLICRRCKVTAHAQVVNEQVTSIGCPSCGLLVEGDAAQEMYISQARYLAMQEAQKVFRGGFGKSRSFRYEPSHIDDPGDPFIIGEPES